MLLSIPYPTWLHPEIIPGLPIRWYGLMYAIAFVVTWFLFKYEAKRRNEPWTEDEMFGFFGAAIAGLLIGARLFGTLVYGPPDGLYWHKPWLIILPFSEDWKFIGFQGMSFHGGLLGVIVGSMSYCARKKFSWLAFADILAVSAPLGYTAGRLGNFINGELWGKVSTSPWGMVFPDAGTFSAQDTMVQTIAAQVGIQITSVYDRVNLPRHPSQLYEALFEGVILWAILWLFFRRREVFRGFAVGCYIIGYGIARFVIEYFREPDKDLGYIIALGDPTAPTWLYTTPLNFSMGQFFSACMIVGALIFLLVRLFQVRRQEKKAIAAANQKIAGGGEG